MVNVFLKNYYILLIFLLVFTISKSSYNHINSKPISNLKKNNNNNNLVINKNENKSIKYISFAESSSNWIENNKEILIVLGIIGVIVIILVIIIIVCLLKLKSKYNNLNEQVNKVSFKTDENNRDSVDDLLE